MSYQTSFHIKTDPRTKELIEQIILKTLTKTSTERGYLLSKAEVFGDLVSKWAKAELEGISA